MIDTTAHVVDNLTGEQVSRTFDTISAADSACYSLNLAYGPGGRYAVMSTCERCGVTSTSPTTVDGEHLCGDCYFGRLG